MMRKITEAIDAAFHIGDILIFLREYPVENVAMDGSIQFENPKILEALKKIGAGGLVNSLRSALGKPISTEGETVSHQPWQCVVGNCHTTLHIT